MAKYVLAIDQGTTSSRAILFDANCQLASVCQKEFEQHFPQSGWVEHEPENIWDTTLETAREAISKAGAAAGDIAAIGITNQRETTLVWDRETGKPIHRAIVWQDRRTADTCTKLKATGHEESFTAKTGLLLDPYFSGTKVAWILDNVDGARAKAEAGQLAFGTVDAFLLWRLTGGKVHATDATNASRTLMYDIHEGAWSEDLWAFSMCLSQCFQKSGIVRLILAKLMRASSAEASRSQASPATSRQPLSARPASSPV